MGPGHPEKNLRRAPSDREKYMIKKILLVDDSPVARKILKKCLPADEGYEVFEAGDGLEGVRKFTEVRPDVTLLDLTMPVMGGIEALTEIKKLDEDAVVIVQTADTQVKSVFMAMDKGAFMVLKKPISKEAIQEALARVDEAQGAEGG